MTDGKKIDVRALAALARIEVPDAELEKLQKEIPSILAFVETIQQADVSNTMPTPELYNVMREDGEPHESGLYTESLLAQAPTRQGNRIVVKQVISRRKNKE
jgi:aspartyl-tRNA(Asn)/glutamyl-tRNA(Gln) amidotransferase subunit C